MADDEEGEKTMSRGNEWEVVSLTASTYAAAPGSKGFDDEKGNEFGEDEGETSCAMFMSHHFVFPPSQHENLPLEPNNSEIYNELGDVVVPTEVPILDVEDGNCSDRKNEENWNVKGLTVPDEFPGIQFFDQKGNKLSVHSTEFEQGMTLQGLNLVDKEHSMYSAAKFSSFRKEAAIAGSSMCDESTVIPELSDPSQQSLDPSLELSKPPNSKKEDEYDEAGLPCEAWWKRRAASLYAHAKETNTFWSVFVAAALMGLVILGQRWQQERLQVQQLKSQFSINDENMNRMLGPIARFKDVIVGSHRQGSAMRGSALAER
ncbi:hypothetical protein HHK36_000193 [Tetracentron sinense]|uniref:ATG8-interacting protein 1 n=1 Tax=Tetracentron sinense TaxID=13715 RepID=A0A835DQP2_TETSI|nr:hypothetical protein HHK36_000193 [Tetracentron sinense]